MEKKILVVEDNLDTRDMLALMLKGEGYAVYTAADGEEGLKLLKMDCPDLIITDINMPRLNGLELIKLVRQLPECSELPIIVMTAHSSGVLTDGLKAGADLALKKPIDPTTLLEGVRTTLNAL